jgi:iron complex transport system ATP-binding protein
MNSPFLLEARGLDVGFRIKRHRPRTVASGINAGLTPGRFVCLLGPNGAGKSTLLRTLTGMQPPLKGEVRILGQDIRRLSPRKLALCLSLVLTTPVDVGMMQVKTLVGLGRHPHTNWRGFLEPEDEDAVAKAIEETGLRSLAHRRVQELSDGERQRVMVARALAQEPQVMVLDEATAFLDLPGRVELMRLLRRLARSGRRAILLATHDLDMAIRCADKLWLLPAGGPLIQGAPEDLVLNDSVARTFQGPHGEFDKTTGSFFLSQPGQRSIGVSGHGHLKLWTEKALVRNGFTVDDAGVTELVVEAPLSLGLPWSIRGKREAFQTIEALLSFLGPSGEVCRD